MKRFDVKIIPVGIILFFDFFDNRGWVWISVKFGERGKMEYNK